MGLYRIRKGLNIQLMGAPASEITDTPDSPCVSVYPGDFEGVKPRLLVKEGDHVRRGDPLFFDKRQESLKITAPAGGVVRGIRLGERRAIREISIEIGSDEEAKSFERYGVEEILALSREEVLGLLLDTGYLAFIRQRPFSRVADPKVCPKSIFVNGMNTAPFQAAFGVVVGGREKAFQAGLNALTRLTAGAVHLCLGGGGERAFDASEAKNVKTHAFVGPHPAGNSSVHIHHIDPISPGDSVWVVRAVDLILIGRLLIEGALPRRKVISVGGMGIRDAARRYYHSRIGGSLSSIIGENQAKGELRFLDGDALGGTRIDADGGIRFYQSSLTVIPEGRERRFLGWMMPGWTLYGASRLFLSRWLKRGAYWNLDTNLNGGCRAMVLTGLYDRYLPMRIMADYLIRAILAHDTDEAVKLGLLETDPEDFALCSFVCPSKMDLVGIVRQGLREVEEEGL